MYYCACSACYRSTTTATTATIHCFVLQFRLARLDASGQRETLAGPEPRQSGVLQAQRDPGKAKPR